MTRDQYYEIIPEDTNLTDKNKFIKALKEIGGKPFEDDSEVKDAGMLFIDCVLWGCYGNDNCYGSYLKTLELIDNKADIVKSKELSDYIKNRLIIEFGKEPAYQGFMSTLESDININDMTEKEIMCIYELSRKSQDKYMTNAVYDYLFRLDGKGVTEFIKNHIDNVEIAEQTISTSYMNPRASFYSGCGVCRDDLNEQKLATIFKKLLKLDVNYAKEFVNFVLGMKTLGATEFIKGFYDFAYNKFKIEATTLDQDNFSVGGPHGEARDLVALISIYSIRERNRYGDNQEEKSNDIKVRFLELIHPILEKEIPDFNYREVYDESCKTYYQSRKKRIK